MGKGLETLRYIRTADGIYTLITKDEPIYELNGKKYYCVEEQISSFSEDEVIKQADTIYELCDYAIIKFPYEKLPHIRNLDEMNRKGKLHNPPAKYIDNLEFLMTDKRAEYIIFAIWNGKRLIDVAEMNNEGDLELL